MYFFVNLETGTYYETGVEVFEKSGEINLNLSIKAIEEYLKKRNTEKYSSFLKQINSTSLLLRIMGVPNIEKRVTLLKYMYYAMRVLDDICDDDTKNNIDIEQRKEIVYKAAGIGKSKLYGLYDLLIEKTLDIAEDLGVRKGIEKSINEICISLKFDIDRIIDSDKFRNREELGKNFDKMDIVGTEFGTALILGINPEETIERLKSLGDASRKVYNLRDLYNDIYANLINIPIEELVKFGINKQDLVDMKKRKEKLDELRNKKVSEQAIRTIEKQLIPASINKWIQSELQKINELMKEYKKGYSFIGILSDRHTIKANYPQSKTRRIFNNLILRAVALPRGYVQEVNQVIGKNSILNLS